MPLLGKGWDVVGVKSAFLGFGWGLRVVCDVCRAFLGGRLKARAVRLGGGLGGGEVVRVAGVAMGW